VDAPRRDDDLRQAITTETRRLAELDVETQQVRARLEALHAELTLADAAPEQTLIPPKQNPNPPNSAPTSTAEKLAIFRRLFRGRENVYPVRFVSKKTGKAGYAPACANKFVTGVCELPRVKCGACPNQAFMPADDAAVLDHLQGRQVMGTAWIASSVISSAIAMAKSANGGKRKQPPARIGRR